MADHYAALGLAPYAEHSAVRAAYVELMRRYHPDINASPEAAARVREVTAAYEVLGNPDSRSDYDLARAHAHAAWAERKSPGLGSPRIAAALATIAGVGLLAFVLLPRDDRSTEAAAVSMPPVEQAERQVQQAERQVATPRPRRIEVAQAPVPPAPAESAPPPAPVKVAAAPAPAVVKAAAAAVEAKPRPTLAAAAPPKVERPRAVPRAPRESRREPDLAALDRHLGILFRQSMRRSDAARQQSLYRDHYRFIARLDACANAACKEREYLARMGEVSTTMTAPAKPR